MTARVALHQPPADLTVSGGFVVGGGAVAGGGERSQAPARTEKWAVVSLSFEWRVTVNGNS